MLKDGDVLNIDVTVIVDGWHGDTSATFCIGKMSAEAKHLAQIERVLEHQRIDALRLSDDQRKKRARIEELWQGEPVQLYALADLDSSFTLTESWVALGPSRVAIVIPADGPSLGVAPAGTWTWMSFFS